MNLLIRLLQTSLLAALIGTAAAQTPQKLVEPRHGQPGKDVVWIPTPDEMVGKMLDIAKVTSKDYVIDLGSGDGRNVIAAAKRGTRALGVEFNPDLVELSRHNAALADVSGRATFVQGDMFEADISKATVMVLFLITDNLRRLTPRLLDLRPGTRIVSNTFEIPGWNADRTYKQGGDCITWCTVFLYIVPAKVAGRWRLPEGELLLEQEFQKISGSINSGGQNIPIEGGHVSGSQIRFTAAGISYTARISGNEMKGSAKGIAAKTWTAVRASS